MRKIFLFGAMLVMALYANAQVVIEEPGEATDVYESEAIEARSAEEADEYDYLDAEEQPVISVRNGKIGWVSSKDSTKVLIPFEYDGVICHFTSGYRFIEECEYQERSAESFLGNNMGNADPYMDYGFIEEDYGYQYHWVRKKGLWGCINNKGEIVFPFEYKVGDTTTVVRELFDGKSYKSEMVKNYQIGLDCSTFYIKKNNKVGLANLQGVVVPCEYDGFVISNVGVQNQYVCRKNGKYGIAGLYNQIIVIQDSNGYHADSVVKGQVNVPCVYDNVTYVRNYSSDTYSEDTYTYFDGEEKSNISELERQLSTIYYKTLKDGKMSFFDYMGVQVNIPNWIEDLIVCQENVYLLKSAGKWGALYNEKYSAFKYDSIEPVFYYGQSTAMMGYVRFSGFYYVHRQGEIYLMGKNMEEIFPKELFFGEDNSDVYESFGDYDEGYIVSEEGIFTMLVKNSLYRYGVVNNEGVKVIPFYYDAGDIERLGTHYIRYKQFGKYGVVNVEGKQVLPCEYEYAELFDYNSYKVKCGKNGRYGLVDYDGKQILPCKYSDFIEDNNCYIVCQFSKWGVVDSMGNQLVPCVYDVIKKGYNSYSNSYDKKKYLVLKDGKCGVINILGKQLLLCEYEGLGKFQ